jgi:hypothetical protein
MRRYRSLVNQSAAYSGRKLRTGRIGVPASAATTAQERVAGRV